MLALTLSLRGKVTRLRQFTYPRICLSQVAPLATAMCWRPCSVWADTPRATTTCLCSRALSLLRCPARGDVFALTWPSGRFAHVSPCGDVTLHEYPGRGDGEGAHPRTGRYRCVCRALVVVPSAWGAPSDVYVYQHPPLLPALPPLSLLTRPYSLPPAH